MKNTILLQGIAKWSYSHELTVSSESEKVLSGMVSFIPPLHYHSGNISLTNSEIIIEGFNDDDDLIISLGTLREVYLGFDELFPVTSVKSFGLFWQPLRLMYMISSVQTQYIYLVIDFNGIFTHDKDWYNTLTALLV